MSRRWMRSFSWNWESSFKFNFNWDLRWGSEQHLVQFNQHGHFYHLGFYYSCYAYIHSNLLSHQLQANVWSWFRIKIWWSIRRHASRPCGMHCSPNFFLDKKIHFRDYNLCSDVQWIALVADRIIACFDNGLTSLSSTFWYVLGTFSWEPGNIQWSHYSSATLSPSRVYKIRRWYWDSVHDWLFLYLFPEWQHGNPRIFLAQI